MFDGKRVLVIISLYDLAGVGEKIKDAVNRHSETWICHNIAHYVSTNKYPIEYLAIPANRRQIKRVLRSADVIQFTHSENMSHILDMSISSNVLKAMAHTGTRYRNNSARLDRQYRNMDVTLVGKSMAHLNPKHIPFMAPIDTDKYKPKPRPANYNNTMVGHSPSHRKRKGTKHFLAAMSKLVAQRRQYPGLMLNLIEGYDFDGSMKQKSKCDIFVDNVSAYYNSFGQSALEAACFGIPILSGKSDIQDPTNPFIGVNQNNLYDELKALIDDKPRQKDLGKKTRKWVVENCSYKFFSDFITRIYDKALADRG